MKRTMFLALALFALMAVGVFAQTEADFKVETIDGGKSIAIIEYTGKAAAVNIPAKIKNLPVTEIKGEAFAGDKNITSVVIPNGVTHISSVNGGAFKECSKLASVTIPNTVTRIGDYAFQSCTSLKNVTVPDSVNIIAMRAFSGCTSLTSVTLGSGVKQIEDSAFAGCTNLTSVTFGSAVPSVHADAFGAASNTRAYLGDLRDKHLAGGIGAYTRSNGTATVWTKSASAAASSSDGTPGLAFALIGDKKGYSVSKGTVGNVDVVIPASYNNLPVTEVGSFETAAIKSVIIPNSVTKIEAMAFSKCIYLTSVTIGSGVQNIGTQAFNGSPKITSVTFQGTFTTPSLFNTVSGFPGDLRDKYLAGGIGTYTRPDNGTTWTKK